MGRESETTAVSQRIAAAVARATDTREVHVGPGALNAAPATFMRLFPRESAMLIADVNTMAAAGKRVAESLFSVGIQLAEPLVFNDPGLYAETAYVERVHAALAGTNAIPVAVGSGTLNDLTKLAAHQCGRPYMVIATAASMDGYTAFGASITHEGSKQTFSCPAPRAVIADVDVLAAAPADMNAAGYADLIAKTCAGADWLLADALGVESINAESWAIVQDHLREWVADPPAIRAGGASAVSNLIEGLLMTGLAMQNSKSSRPASGAEHQFSHLWDMQHHQFRGRAPYHGFKVGIGTVASTLLYEELFAGCIETLDVDAACRDWPSLDEVLRGVREMHSVPDVRTVAEAEMRAKYIDRDELHARLRRLKAAWPTLQPRLQAQLVPSAELMEMLAAAGAPSTSTEIGIDLPRLRRSYTEAFHIRRRFTVLDVAVITGLMPACLERVFGRI
jgi:glycerol-1-phosphate dehydrogenase [NAD(P)+]